MISCLQPYCVPASLGAFPSHLSVRTGQAALLINLQDYRHCSPCSRAETISSGSAPPGEEPEPLQPLGHTSDKQGWAEEEAGLIWGIRRHEEESGFSSDLQLMFEKIKIKKNCIYILQKIFLPRGNEIAVHRARFRKCTNLLSHNINHNLSYIMYDFLSHNFSPCSLCTTNVIT